MRRSFGVTILLVLFALFSCVQNSSPTVPIPIFPEDGSVGIGTKLRLVWDCGDPENDALHFDVYFGKSSSPALLKSGIEERSLEIDDLEYGTQYYWRVIAEDEHGARTPGPVWTFKTVKNFPPRIHSPSPRDGETDVGTATILSWNFDDPESDTVYFDVYFGKGLLLPIATRITTTRVELKDLDYDTEYLWKVIAFDSFGNVTKGPIWKFRTIENKPPEIEYLSPKMGVSGVELSQTLEWSARDPEGDGMRFNVFFGKTHDPELVLERATRDRYTVENLDYGKTYFWKVVVSDGYNEVEGPVWWFTTKANLPPDLIYKSPRNGTYGIPLSTYLVWKAEDPEGDEVLFDVYFGTNEMRMIAENTSRTSVRVSNLKYETLYKWKVVAKDSYGNAIEGPVWSFRTIVNFAPILKYVSPADGSTGLGTEVRLEWKGDDPEGEDITYYVYFGEEDKLNLVASGVNFERYEIKGLEYGRTYGWMVVARDSYGNEVKGPVWRFTTRNNSPPVLEYIYPENGKTDLPLEVKLSWRAYDPEGDDVLFRVYLGSDKDLSLVENDSRKAEYKVSLLHGKEYRWKVVAVDSYGNTTEGPVWSFSTADFPSFSRIFGGGGLDEGRALECDSNGCLIAGYTYSTNGNVSNNRGSGDAWIIRIDTEGNLVWERSFGGSRKDVFNDVIASGDRYIMVGYTLSDDGDVKDSKGSADFWFVAIDPDGELVWEKTFGGSNWDEAHAICSAGDGYVLVGTTKSSDGDVSYNFGGKDVWIVRIDGSGNILWERTFGGSGWDEAMDVECSDNSCIAVGYTTGDTRDLLVLRFDLSGNLIWQRVFGGTGADVANSVLELQNGGYIVAGYTSSSDGNVPGNFGGEDAWILSLDENGDILWSKTFGGAKDEKVQAITPDPGGDYIAAGFSSKNGEYDFYVIGLNDRGDVVWQELLGGSSMDKAFDVQPFMVDGFIVLGTSMSDDGDVPGNLGSGDMWILSKGKP